MILGNTRFELDQIDVHLLQMLQDDCTTSLAKLGEGVDLSPPSVMERIRKMEEAGIIRGYTALLDARALGLDITAFIGVGVAYPKGIDALVRLVAELPAVLECHHITGTYTMMLKIKTRNTASLEQLISRIRSTDGDERTETIVVLSTLAERVRVALDPSAVAPSEPSPPKRRAAKAKAKAKNEENG
jgi:Lrp/AsnC family leucine-responsive transcriptional regulator